MNVVLYIVACSFESLLCLESYCSSSWKIKLICHLKKLFFKERIIIILSLSLKDVKLINLNNYFITITYITS